MRRGVSSPPREGGSSPSRTLHGERATRAAQVAANLRRAAARRDAEEEEEEAQLATSSSDEAAQSDAIMQQPWEDYSAQHSDESFRSSAGDIFDRLEVDASRRQAEAEHRDRSKERALRQKMLRKQAELRKARTEFERSARSADDSAQLASWRHLVEADSRVINGFNAAGVAPSTPTVPERDEFLDRMANDVGERLKGGRGIHSLTARAPTVQSSRRLKSPAPQKSSRPTSPELIDAAVKLQKAQRGMSQRQRVAQDLAAEMNALEAMVLRGEGDKDDYERLLQLHRWAKLQHGKPKPVRSPELKPRAAPPRALKPFVPAHNTDAQTFNLPHKPAEPKKTRAASPTRRASSPPKSTPSSPPPRASSPVSLPDHSRRRPPHAFALQQHGNAEHHEHHGVSSRTETHADENQARLLSYASPAQHQELLRHKATSQNLHAQFQQEAQTTREGLPRAATSNMGGHTPLPTFGRPEDSPAPAEESSGDETDTESDTDGTGDEIVLHEGDVHVCIPGSAHGQKWYAAQMQLIRSRPDHRTTIDRLRWRPKPDLAASGDGADLLGEADESSWFVRPVQSVRLWQEPGLAGHPLIELHDAYGYTFCLGQDLSNPVESDATAPTKRSARTRSQSQRRWSRAGAESRVPERVCVDECARGTPAAATEALAQLYRRLNSKTAVVHAFKTIDAGVGTWRQGGPGALRMPELRKVLSLLDCPLNAEQVKHVMEAIDRDGDGEVDVREFIDFVWRGRTDLLRRKLGIAAYTFGGHDYVKLFHHYDRDNSGGLSSEEFRRAVRKDVKVRPNEVPDDELQELFDGTCSVPYI